MKIRSIIIFGLALLIFGCASNTHYWVHKDHGRLSSDDPIVKADSDPCYAEAYKQGLEIDGEIYTNRDAVFHKVVDGVLKRGASQNKEEPPYWKDFNRIEKQGRDCFIAKGWTFDK